MTCTDVFDKFNIKAASSFHWQADWVQMYCIYVRLFWLSRIKSLLVLIIFFVKVRQRIVDLYQIIL